MSCLTCTPAMPVDMAFELAKNKADAESKQTGKPIAVIEENGQFETRNAFEAYAAGCIVREIISTYKGDTAK